LAWQWSDELLIHSLEGCVAGLPGAAAPFDWEQAVRPPNTAGLARGLHAALRGTLWASAHPWRVEDYDANNLARFPAAAASVTSVNLLQVLGGHKR
jgi:hypothetical protein